jgi:hypothetical protein
MVGRAGCASEGRGEFPVAYKEVRGWELMSIV